MADGNPVTALAEDLRAEADRYARDGARLEAEKVLTRVADQLEEAWREYRLEELTLREAAEESAYSYDHLSEILRENPALNAGEKGSPRIRRCDLPKKPGAGNGSIRASRRDFADEVVTARDSAEA